MRLDIISESKARPLVQNPGIMCAEDEGQRIGFNLTIRISELRMIEKISTIPSAFPLAYLLVLRSPEPHYFASVFIDKCWKRNTMETTY